MSNPATAPDRAVNGTRVTDHHGRARTVKAGYLSVSETSFDRPGAPSPFGEDIEFPLPIDRLTFVPLSDEERS